MRTSAQKDTQSCNTDCMIDQRLHVLRMLAEHGTVTAVARALNYTPSAVSHQLRRWPTTCRSPCSCRTAGGSG